MPALVTARLRCPRCNRRFLLPTATLQLPPHLDRIWRCGGLEGVPA